MSHCTVQYEKKPTKKDARIGRNISNSKDASNSRIASNSKEPATALTKATVGTPTTQEKSEIARRYRGNASGRELGNSLKKRSD